jgi:hypothetical protein
MEPDAGEAAVEAGRGARDAQVARECQVQTGADGGAVHRGHSRQRAAIEAQESLVDRGQARVAALLAPAHGGQAADVGPGAERGRRARHHERAHAVVTLELVNGRDDLVDEPGGEHIPAVGIVEGEHRDAIATLDA